LLKPSAGNIKPDKEKSTRRINDTVAFLMKFEEGFKIKIDVLMGRI